MSGQRALEKPDLDRQAPPRQARGRRRRRVEKCAKAPQQHDNPECEHTCCKRCGGTYERSITGQPGSGEAAPSTPSTHRVRMHLLAMHLQPDGSAVVSALQLTQAWGHAHASRYRRDRCRERPAKPALGLAGEQGLGNNSTRSKPTRLPDNQLRGHSIGCAEGSRRAKRSDYTTLSPHSCPHARPPPASPRVQTLDELENAACPQNDARVTVHKCASATSLGERRPGAALQLHAVRRSRRDNQRARPRCSAKGSASRYSISIETSGSVTAHARQPTTRHPSARALPTASARDVSDMRQPVRHS